MIYVWIIALFLPFAVFGSPAEEIPEHSIPVLDTVQDLFGSRVNSVANDFDSFFATERADDELGRSRIRFRRRYTVEERQLMTDDTAIRFNIRMPSLERKFKNMVESRKKKKDETKEESVARERRYLKATDLDTKWLFRSDVAVSASIHPNITGRARLRKSFKTGDLIHRFVQEGTWRSYQEGFRQRTQVQTDFTIRTNLLLRLNNLADWRISQKNFTTTHGPAIFHRVTEDDAFTYSYGVSTTVDDGAWYVSNHSVGPTWRRNLYHQFFYMDLGTGLYFRKTWHFRRTPFVFIQLELLFGT